MSRGLRVAPIVRRGFSAQVLNRLAHGRELRRRPRDDYNMLVTLHGGGSIEARLLGAYRDADIDGMTALVERALAA